MSRFNLKSHDYLVSEDGKRLFNERLCFAIAEPMLEIARSCIPSEADEPFVSRILFVTSGGGTETIIAGKDGHE